MAERKHDLDAAGVTVVGVATREDYQARRLVGQGLPFELFLDPDDSFRRALGTVARFSAWRLLHPAGAVDYARAVRQARSFDPVWSEATQRPGVVLFDEGLRVSWSHFGRRIGDYPSVEEVVAAVS